MMRYVKVFRSLSKFVLHPLIHTLLESILALVIVGNQGKAIEKEAPLSRPAYANGVG
jgi:hypothetical protein